MNKTVLYSMFLLMVFGCRQDNPPEQTTSDGQEPNAWQQVTASSGEMQGDRDLPPSYHLDATTPIRRTLRAAAAQVPGSKLEELETQFESDPYYHMELATGDRKEVIPVLLAGMKSQPGWVGALFMFPAQDRRATEELAPKEKKAYYLYTLAYLQEASALLQPSISGQTTKREGLAMLQSPMAHAAMEVGEYALSKQIAKDMLAGNNDPNSWNYGNVIHEANTVLGQVFLRESDMKKAKHHLIESAKSPGSPQLRSFGPSFTLARELLEKGEQEVVLQFLDLVAVFWANPDNATRALAKRNAQDHAEELLKWKQEITAGSIPQHRKWR